MSLTSKSPRVPPCSGTLHHSRHTHCRWRLTDENLQHRQAACFLGWIHVLYLSTSHISTHKVPSPGSKSRRKQAAVVCAGLRSSRRGMESSETLLGITLSSSGGFWSKGWADVRHGRVYVFSMDWVAGGMKRQAFHFTVACVCSTRAWSTAMCKTGSSVRPAGSIIPRGALFFWFACFLDKTTLCLVLSLPLSVSLHHQRSSFYCSPRKPAPRFAVGLLTVPQAF